MEFVSFYHGVPFLQTHLKLCAECLLMYNDTRSNKQPLHIFLVLVQLPAYVKKWLEKFVQDFLYKGMMREESTISLAGIKFVCQWSKEGWRRESLDCSMWCYELPYMEFSVKGKVSTTRVWVWQLDTTKLCK